MPVPNKTLLLFIVLIAGLAALHACSEQQPVTYESLIEKGLDSGERHDTLFLGYHFGMTRQDFQTSSWEMNREGIITGLTKVEYTNRDWLPFEAYIEFFPDFEDGKISRLPLDIHYRDWAPWNQNRFSDSLATELAQHFAQVYGQDFHWMFLPEADREGWFSVRGNRAISVWRRDDMWVRAVFRDLTVDADIPEGR
ncbi:hypothetical protein CYPRO_2335 [Cyclonatronum proteinivorum]|uniref:Lipoprotein n=1 Tax=Cyclonatronum proteinivorum TaxID=1457365 RepID=A0A345UM75_9BACT|nr:hypothetical protein [Cyclonatronum proteinivorum]AXJ01577.1 hypothetical protein CYPRO_2335 [Cyclonatronum proteinivorum]